MRITLNRRRNQGLAFLALILFVLAVLVIGGTIVYILVKICRRAFPEPPPDHQAQIEQVEPAPAQRVLDPIAAQGDPVPAYQPAAVQPVFRFPAIPAIPTATASDPLGGGWIEIQRSTNLVDWTTILKTNLSYQFVIADDTNPPCPMAFYRMDVVTP